MIFFKAVMLTVVFLLMPATILAQTATAPATGDGSAGNPYQIASLENLYWISAPDAVVPSPTRATRWAAHYKQTADIDASSTAGWGNGGWTPIGVDALNYFSGSYDGDGHLISGLYIDRSSALQGMFGIVQGANAHISNLGLRNVDITGSASVGGLAAVVTSSAKVSNCHVTGSVTGTGDWVGGLAGTNQGGAVTDSYVMGTVSGADIVGGLIGDNYASGSINNCYSAAKVSGTGSKVGGLTGDNSDGTGATTNSFWDKDISEQGSSAGGTGKTTSELQVIATYNDTTTAGLDAAWHIVAGWTAFNAPSDIWGICPSVNNGYPFLLWRYDTDPCSAVPAVTTQPVTDISTTTATGHGTITSLGSPAPTSHGVCWSTSQNPSTSDSCTNLGPASTTGAFTSQITALTSGTSYHVRAYATNDVGTSYGEQREFTTETLPNTYTVSYDANGATSGTAPASQTKTQGVDLTLASNTGNLAKTGFTFAGWNTAADGSGTDYAEGATYTTDAALALYAKWTTLPTYTVTYDANGATSGTTPANQTKTQGIDLTLAANTGNLAKTGHAFAGWNTTADGSGTDYAEGATYTADAGVTLYAKWTTLPTYTVTYDANGASSGTTPANQTKTQGVNLTLATNTGNLTKTGHAFAGWNTTADGTGTDYAEGATYTADAGVTLYAKWRKIDPHAIPTLSEWGVMLLTVLLLVLGAAALRGAGGRRCV